MRREGPKGL